MSKSMRHDQQMARFMDIPSSCSNERASQEFCRARIERPGPKTENNSIRFMQLLLLH